MSYCRTSSMNFKCNVYLYGDVNGMFCCCGCQLLVGTFPHRRDRLRYAQTNSVWLSTRSEAILHLRHHKLHGHKFPRRVERTLLRELKEEGEYMIDTSKATQGNLFTATVADKSSPWKGPMTKEKRNEIRRLKRYFEKTFGRKA